MTKDKKKLMLTYSQDTLGLIKGRGNTWKTAETNQ